MHATLSSNNVVGLSFEKGGHMIIEYVGSLILTIYIHGWLHVRSRSLNDLMTWLPLFA